MLRLNVNNETSKLKAVVLGIGNSLGSAPTANECYDPKSRFQMEHELICFSIRFF